MKKQFIIIYLILLLPISAKSEEKNYPLYTNLEQYSCNYRYSFPINEAYHKSDPIYLKTEFQNVFYYKNNFPITTLKVFPYIFKGQEKKKIFFKRDKTSFDLILKSYLPESDRFCFFIYIYGLDQKDVTTHIYNMKLQNNHLWRGNFSELKYVIRHKKQKLRYKSSKWIKDFSNSKNIYAFALLMETSIEMPKEQTPHKRSSKILNKYDEILITHKNKIAFLRDIFFEKYPKLSLKKSISHKPGRSDEEYIIIPYDNKLFQKKVILRLVLGNSEEKLFLIDFAPGKKYSLDDMEVKQDN